MCCKRQGSIVVFAQSMKSPIIQAETLREFGTGASFTLQNRLTRLVWKIIWWTLAKWTPEFFNPWRIFLLRMFGATISPSAAISSSARIWLPSNLKIDARSTLGPRVNCYNMAEISIGARSVISQGAFLCAGSHDINDETFQLVAKPISIGDDVWIAAEAFVAPGVEIAAGCVLAARGCAFSNMQPWTVYRGNPAVAIKARKWNKEPTHAPAVN
jgi:putative colanic acid biosynthesis acetyltransferase WcaF